MGIFSSSKIRIVLLEKLITTILEGALSRVTEEGWAPSGVDASEAFCPEYLTPALDIRGIQFRVDLSPTLDKIKWSNSSVSEALVNVN